MKVVFKKQSEQQTPLTWGDVVGCVVTGGQEAGKAYLAWGTTLGKYVILRDINDMTKDLILSFETRKLVDQSSWKVYRDVTLTVEE